MNDHITLLRTYAQLAPVIPVVTIEDARLSIDLAETLVAAGLPVIEITLRTPAALDAIAAITKAVPGAVVAAGTVLRRSQIAEVIDAGAKFIVTPGDSDASGGGSRRRCHSGHARLRDRLGGFDAGGDGLRNLEVLPGRGVRRAQPG